MTNKTVSNGRNVWRDTRPSNMWWYVMTGIGILCTFFGIIGSITNFQATILIFIAVGIMMVLGGLHQIGATDIVFDDNSNTIYIEDLRWCYKKVNKHHLGNYADFREAVVVEESLEGEFWYSIQYSFTGGLRSGTKHAKAIQKNRGPKDATVQQINSWWKTTPHYVPNQQPQPQPVQVVMVPNAAALNHVNQPVVAVPGQTVVVVQQNAVNAPPPQYVPATQ